MKIDKRTRREELLRIEAKGYRAYSNHDYNPFDGAEARAWERGWERAAQEAEDLESVPAKRPIGNPDAMTGELPKEPFASFSLMAQGPKLDYTVEAISVNGMLTICTVNGPIYVTKAQAMAFFNLRSYG